MDTLATVVTELEVFVPSDVVAGPVVERFLTVVDVVDRVVVSAEVV